MTVAGLDHARIHAAVLTTTAYREGRATLQQFAVAWHAAAKAAAVST